MGKISTNPKSIESRERKANQASEAKAAKEKAKEDAYWADNLGFFIFFHGRFNCLFNDEHF